MDAPRIKVSLPWNSANYVALNGFHPLYEFLYASGDSVLELLTLDFLRWQDLLQKPDNAGFLTEFLVEINKVRRTEESVEASEFWQFFDFNEALIDEISECHTKLIHTSPVWAGIKPFVFQVESFESIFLPWSIEDPFLVRTSAAKVSGIRRFLLDVFQSPQCLAIVSHLGKTLEAFRRFFGSERINAKLRFCPIGFRAVSIPRPTRATCRFLVSSSQHGHSDDSIVESYGAVLSFVAKWHKVYPEDEFVFLSRTDREHLKRLGCSPRLLAVLDSPKVFCFNGQYLDRAEYEALLRTCDFDLLTSRQAPSASILKSMGFGVIPVVMDLEQIVDYGIGPHNAVVLQTREKMRVDKRELSDEVWSMTGSLDAAEALAVQMIERLLPLRHDSSQRQKISGNATEHIARRCGPKDARRQFTEVIVAAMNQAPPPSSPLADALGACWRGRDRFGPLSTFVPGLRPVLPSDYERRRHFDPLVDLGTTTILSDGISCYAQRAGAPKGGNFFAWLQPDRNLLIPDVFSAWAYPASWGSVADRAVVSAADGAKVAVESGSPLRAWGAYLLNRAAVPVRRHPWLKSVLKSLGVHRLVARLGFGAVWAASSASSRARVSDAV